MHCPICQTSFFPSRSDATLLNCPNCGAPVRNTHHALSDLELKLLTERWEHWGKHTWRVLTALRSENEAIAGQPTTRQPSPAKESRRPSTRLEESEPTLGGIASELGNKVTQISGRWLSSNPTVSRLIDKIDTHLQGFTDLENSTDTAFFSEPSAFEPGDTLVSEVPQTLPTDIPIQPFVTDSEGEAIAHPSRQGSVYTEDEQSSGISEADLIEEYNRDAEVLCDGKTSIWEARTTTVKQTADSVRQYFQGTGKAIEFEASAAGKYWIVQSTEIQNHTPSYYLVLRRDVRLNRQNLGSVRACFDLENAINPKHGFDLVSPAVLRPIKGTHLWMLIRRGAVRFRLPPADSQPQ
ncbi:MAG: hypothetical protein AAFY72_07020 [Cyanobacteria bacterium J06649_4]